MMSSKLLRLVQDARRREVPRWVRIGVIDDCSDVEAETERRIAQAKAEGRLRECDNVIFRIIIDPRVARCNR